ncbi:MAG TPA: thioredoxin domain-containing protein [Oculatellaceae cyanobacterium]
METGRKRDGAINQRTSQGWEVEDDRLPVQEVESMRDHDRLVKHNSSTSPLENLADSSPGNSLAIPATKTCKSSRWHQLVLLAVFSSITLNSSLETWAANSQDLPGAAVIKTTKPIPLEAINAVENSEWKAAASALQAYVKSESASAEGHYLLGKSLFNLKRYPEAKEELRKALKLGQGDNFSNRANEMLLKMPKAVIAPRQVDLGTSRATIKGRRVAAAGIARPRILSFSAKWAEPCKQLQSDLDKAKTEFGEQIEISTVDVDDPKNEELMNQYEVSPIPTVVFLDAQGKVVNFLIGYSDPAELERSIKKVLNKS